MNPALAATSGDAALPAAGRPSRERLHSILTARSVALVGASDNSRWSLTTFATATTYGFPGVLHLVNRRGASAHGRPTATSCAAIGEPIDVAVILVGAAGLPDAVRDAAAAGARGVVALASGFGEAGAAGRAAQRGLAELAGSLDVTLFGPNCLGFVNLADRVTAWASPPPVPDPTPGSVALISQSGGIAIQLGRFAAKQDVRYSHIVSTGNEAAVDSLDIARVLVDDDRVRALAMFVETIADAARFDDLAARAAELEKPVVMLKAGRSELASEVIASHTGALAGDDRVIDVALRQAGVIRVDSLEELVATAGLAAGTGRLPGGGLGVVSISGGACDLVVDAADAYGTPLAPLGNETSARLEAAGSDYGTVRNPLDVTGAAVGGPQLMVDAIEAVAADANVGIVAVVDALPDGWALPVPGARLIAVGESLAGIDKPCVVVHQVAQDLPPAVAERVASLGIRHWLTGLDLSVRAIGALIRWSEWSPPPDTPTLPPIEISHSSLTEGETLDLLERYGIPAAPHRVVHTAEEARAAARACGFPAVVKLSSRDVKHKSDIGGVILGVPDGDAAEQAFARVTTAATAVPGVAVDGALVMPMRSGGVELIVGALRDPQWGLVIAVGLGGIWVNVLNDSALRRAPLDARVAREMLGELRGSALLEGARGGPPADLDRVASIVVAFAAFAEALGPDLESIEINPLRVDGDIVEALDAAITWR